VEHVAVVRWRVQQRCFILIRVTPDATGPDKEATSPGLCWSLVMREGAPLGVVDLLIETMHLLVEVANDSLFTALARRQNASGAMSATAAQCSFYREQNRSALVGRLWPGWRGHGSP
jgi:hypothetical protein